MNLMSTTFWFSHLNLVQAKLISVKARLSHRWATAAFAAKSKRQHSKNNSQNFSILGKILKRFKKFTQQSRAMAGEGGGRRRGKRSRSSDFDRLDATHYDSKLFPKPTLHQKLVMTLHRDTSVYVKHDNEWRACTLQRLYCQQRDPEVVNRYASDYMYVHLEAEVAIPSLPDIVNKTVKAEAIKFNKPQKKLPRSGMDLSVANDNEEEEGM